MAKSSYPHDDVSSSSSVHASITSIASSTTKSSSTSSLASSPPPSSLVTCGCAAARPEFFSLTSGGADDRATQSAFSAFWPKIKGKIPAIKCSSPTSPPPPQLGICLVENPASLMVVSVETQRYFSPPPPLYTPDVLRSYSLGFRLLRSTLRVDRFLLFPLFLPPPIWLCRLRRRGISHPPSAVTPVTASWVFDCCVPLFE